MKIGLFTDSYYSGTSGIATSVKALKECLNKMGHNAYVIAGDPSQKQITCVDDEIKIPSIYFPTWNVNIVNFMSNKNIDYLKSFNFDVVHTHSELTVGLLANRLSKIESIPHVHTAHTFYKYYYHYALGNTLKLGEYTEKWMVERFCLNNADELIVPSTEFGQDLKERFSIREDYNVIKTGIDIDKFNNGNLSKQEIRKKLNLTDKNFVLLYVGRLAIEKNLELLLYGQSMIKKYPNIKLVICGKGNCDKKLKNLAKQLNIENSIRFMGEISNDQINKMYFMSDVFVMPSFSETQGLTLFEAAASGKPIVCFDSSAYNSIVYKGINGYKFKNIEEYKKAIEMLYNNPTILRQYSENSKIISKQFSKENYAKNIEKVYKKIYTK